MKVSYRESGDLVKSIISNERECIICKTTLNLHRHHIYHGTANRKKSEKFGCWCYLCARHHAQVHADIRMDEKLKRQTQDILGWSEEDFIKVFGKSYKGKYESERKNL